MDLFIMAQLVKIANEEFDGHLTILKFTTNWRIGFETPNSRQDIGALAGGPTFVEAAQAAIARRR
jgi:hypothetical protein